jgi:hypothetical protein
VVDQRVADRVGLSEERKDLLWQHTYRGVFTFTVVGFGVVITG